MRLKFLSLICFLMMFSVSGCSYNDDLMEEYKAESEDESGDVIVQSSHEYRNKNYDVVKVSSTNSKKGSKKEIVDNDLADSSEDSYGSELKKNDTKSNDETKEAKKAISNKAVEQGKNDESGCYYVVQNGDTLYGFSKKTNTKISAIKSLNSMNDDDFNIKIGQKLKINCNQIDLLNKTDNGSDSVGVESSRDEFTDVKKISDVKSNNINDVNNTSAEVKSSTLLQGEKIDAKPVNNKVVENSIDGDLNSNKQYVVKQGDTFYGLSRRYNVKIADIYKANNIQNGDSFILKIGSSIYLPASVNIEVEPKNDNVNNNVDKSIVEKKQELKIESKQAIKSEVRAEASVGSSEIGKLKNVQKNEKYIMPIKTKIVSYFGKKKKGLYNDGLLFDVSSKTSIVAAKSGYVFHSSFLKNYNNLVIIKHSDGYLTIYGNLDKVNVKRGDVVSIGYSIGTVNPLVSKTFYFAIRNDKDGNKPIDPLKLVK